MANYDSSITLGGVTLNVTSLEASKEQKTQKQVIGKTLNELEVLGLASKQWRLRIGGVILGNGRTELGTNRDALEALDDTETHAYVDGIHDGTYYIVPGSLKIPDGQDDAGMIYRYTVELVEQ